MKRIVLGAFGLALVIGELLPGAAWAADTGGRLEISSSPLPVNLEIAPGGSVTTDLRVKQSSSPTARLKVSLMKFAAYGDEGKPLLLDRQPGDDYFDWVKFDKTEFDAPQNVWQTVKMKINVPKTAAFGYYYAVTFSRVGDDVKRGNRTNSLAGSTATLVLLDAKSPGAKRILSLDSFGVGHRVYEFLPSEFNVKLANSGNVHVVPHGDIFVSQGKKTMATLPINSAFGNMLPQSKRIFPVGWDAGFPAYVDSSKLDKKGKPVRNLKWDWSKVNQFRIGKYTAHLLAVYDNGKRDVPVEAELSFWVIPWRMILVVLVIAGAIGFLVYSTVRGTLRKAARLGRRHRK